MNTRLPPVYSGKFKYDEAVARRYQVRNPAKQKAELALVARAIKSIPPGRLLDIPCGGGRMSRLLASYGFRVTAADYSEAMLAITAAQYEGAAPEAIERQDIERLSYADGAFDQVLCFRLFHHFPTPEIRQRAISELCRVSADMVAVSYFSPWAPTSLKYQLKAKLGLPAGDKFATPLSELRRYFAVHGFVLESDHAQCPLLRRLHLAVFRRQS